jgi:toxin FitB
VKYLLDTNIVSEVMKSSPDSGVIQWLENNDGQLALSAVVLAELAAGVESLPEGKRKSELMKRLRFLQEDFADAILAFDETVAWEWARYQKDAHQAGCRPPLMDSLVAATARAWGMTMVSRNAADFPLVPVLNPFSHG